MHSPRSRPTSVIHLRLEPDEPDWDEKEAEPDLLVLTTARSASFSVDLLEPPAKDRYQSHLAGTFTPGATCKLLIHPNIKGEAPAKRWKSLTVRLSGTSEVRPHQAHTTFHTILRMYQEVSLVGRKGAGEPIAVQCQSCVKVPISIYYPPYESEVPNIAGARATRDWRKSTLVGPEVAVRMPEPYEPIDIVSAKLEHVITELPDELNISWRLFLKTSAKVVDNGAALISLFDEDSFSLILARRMVPVAQGTDSGDAPASRIPQRTRRNPVEILRQGQAGPEWSDTSSCSCPIKGVRLSGETVVSKLEVPIIRSCNGGTQFYLIGRIQSLELIDTRTDEGGEPVETTGKEITSPVALNVHKRLFVPRKDEGF